VTEGSLALFDRLTAIVGVTVTAIVLQAPRAQAGCTRDSDCKGDRICEDGRCINPPPSNQPQAGPTVRPPPAGLPSTPAFPVRPQAQPATNEQVGSQLFEAGRYAEAAAEFEKAYRATADPALLYSVAVSFRLAGDTKRALEAYEDYLIRVPDSPNRPAVEERMRQLRQEQMRAAATTTAQPAQTATPAPPTAPIPPAQGANGFLGGAAPSPPYCNPSCNPGQWCTESGVCVPVAIAPVVQPAPTAGASPTEGRWVAAAPDAQHGREDEPHVGETPSALNIHVNALGVLQFGLMPTVEIGRQMSVLFNAHIFAAGALSYLLLPDDENDSFKEGWGGGMRLRYYPSGAQRGFFFGGGAEYVYIKTADEEDDEAEYITHALVPMGDVGYRWVWGRFLFAAGGLAGVAVPISSEDVPIGPHGCHYYDSCPNKRDPFPFIMAALDVGWFL
jgi:tetratricopeptide (TPR) repeat protein